MLLNSLFFIFAFLPVVLLVYYLIPGIWRNWFLLAAGLVFYAWGDPVYLVLLMFSTVLHYGMGKRMGRREEKEKRRGDMIFTVTADIFVLCFFKYWEKVTGQELPLPIGLSFYTFKNISYVLDVYRGDTAAEEDFAAFSAYAVLFPTMTAGPIVRYGDLKAQLHRRFVNAGQMGRGAARFLTGLGKKVLISDSLAVLYGQIQGAGDDISMLTAWIGIAAFTLQIYFDFSGYSDMAIGIGRMLGFTLKENFEYPYTAGSVTEFWRRWHISLGSWFRDYVYIPLGGNRVGKAKHIRNILTVWALTGIWHGATANFLIWGLYYGIFLLLEKYVLKDVLLKAPKPLAHIWTMLIVIAGWVFFSHDSLADGIRYLGCMAGVGVTRIADTAAFYYLKTNAVLFLICIAASGPWLKRQADKLLVKSMTLTVLAYGILFLLCIAGLVYSSYHPFLYLRF